MKAQVQTNINVLVCEYSKKEEAKWNSQQYGEKYEGNMKSYEENIKKII